MEYSMNEKKLTGRITPERIKMLEVPRLPNGVLEAFKDMRDLTGLISDTLDALGLPGTVGASTLRPTIAGARVIGPALTLRNIVKPPHDPYTEASTFKVTRNFGGMAEIEAHNLALPGDVLVIDGIEDVSNMGGNSAALAQNAGELAAIVDGGIRDVDHSTSIGFPMWSRQVTPVTGKWRIETIEINGPVQICGVRVCPGDLVVADDTGVCFVPRERILEVFKLAMKKGGDEAKRMAQIEGGVPLIDIYYLPE
jgi:regulator of RNase E activity RraA